MSEIIQIEDTTTLLKRYIIDSRLQAVRLVNREQLILYYFVGAILRTKTDQAKWGDAVLKQISNRLNQELPGLRGFSAQNLKKMRQFYDCYPIDSNSNLQKGSSAVNQLMFDGFQFGSPAVNQLQEHFWNLGFSLHFIILTSVKKLEDRLFYIEKASSLNWTKAVLSNHLRNKIHLQSFIQSNNFKDKYKIYQKVQEQFRDEYLLDFINIEEAQDEKRVEHKIVENIRNFLLNLGTGFTFMGNQYRLNVGEEEYFIDLLFYNRQIKSLVAIELKKGKFRPADAGQLNFYLNVLDEQIRLEGENPSIGIVLCREKNDATVDFALRNINSPMGVALYKSKEQVPDLYRKILPKSQDLIDLINLEKNQ